MDKVTLREEYLRMRRGLRKEEVLEKSSKISKKLLKLPILKTAKIVSAYLPLNNEVETKPIIDFLIKEDKRVFVPQFANYEYRFCEFKDWNDLEEGPLGILQPKTQDSISADLLDVAILPGVAFDLRCMRLGYGKGVFDQLLEGSKAYRIGLAYYFQIVEKLPREKHDLVMNVVVTEKRIIRSNDHDSLS